MKTFNFKQVHGLCKAGSFCAELKYQVFLETSNTAFKTLIAVILLVSPKILSSNFKILDRRIPLTLNYGMNFYLKRKKD